MNEIIFPEEVVTTITHFYRNSAEDQRNIILDIGSVLLNVSADTLVEMINANV